MKRLLFVCSLLVTLAHAEEAKWVTLFDGKTLNRWTNAGDANWREEDGAIVVDQGEAGFLVHDDTYKNYELKVEFKAAKCCNSGIFPAISPCAS